jgi:hypothetical protein
LKKLTFEKVVCKPLDLLKAEVVEVAVVDVIVVCFLTGSLLNSTRYRKKIQLFNVSNIKEFYIQC